MPDYETILEYSTIILLGLAILLPIIIYLMLRARLSRMSRQKDREIQRLKEQLQLKMEIDSDAEVGRRKRLDELQKENENLRIRVQEYRQKPRRDGERQAQIYERALAIMHERAPGFSGAWAKAYQEAENEMEQSEKGLLNFAKRALLPGSGAAGRRTLEDRSGENGDNQGDRTDRNHSDEDIRVG